ncbi:MAG: heavy-metal-associated domain-containing protein [Gammaproteobacteria bacterium]|nr:heavy-metal-associated domain-containing protein [Gammaproteobacteria bacterium]
MSITLKIEGMTCDHCVRAVTRALKSVPGVKDAKVSLERGEAVVEGQSERDALIQAVEGEGYGARAD